MSQTNESVNPYESPLNEQHFSRSLGQTVVHYVQFTLGSISIVLLITLGILLVWEIAYRATFFEGYISGLFSGSVIFALIRRFVIFVFHRPSRPVTPQKNRE